MDKLDNRVLHLVMYLWCTTKSGVSFQTAWAFAVILAALLSATYLDVASQKQSKTELKTIFCLLFDFYLAPSLKTLKIEWKMQR